MTAPDAAPYRLVDANGGSWLPAYKTGEPPAYRADYPRELGPLGYEEIVAQHGPVRHVEAPTDADCELIRTALVGAGAKAAVTLFAAVHSVAVRTPGGLMWAGRPGSWESHSMRDLAWACGAGASRTRVDRAAKETVGEVLMRWVTGDPFVEVAETLAGISGDVTDRLGGWRKMADQWLRASDHEESARNLLTYRSERYRP